MTTGQAPELDLTARAEQLETLRARVLNVVGHELRTPITTIRGLAEALEAADPHRIRQEIAPALLRMARRVERLLDDLLTASGIGTVLPVEPPQPVEVSGRARDVWASLPPAAGRATLEVRGEGTALVAPSTLRRILELLLDNAAKYGVAPMELTVERAGEVVRTVLDTAGPPLPDDEVALATEPFFRGEHAVMTAPGMGLGLAVARVLAEHTGGSLRVERRPGGGLVTVVELPAP